LLGARRWLVGQFETAKLAEMDTMDTMETIRTHRLYPRLTELVTEAQIAKMATRIPPVELTVYRLLYDACMWSHETSIRATNTMALYETLRAARTDGVDADGYIVKYEVGFDQCWPGVVKDLARLGITSVRKDALITLSYTHLPEISHVVYFASGQTYKHGLSTYDGVFTRLSKDLELRELQKKIVGAHGTPYQEEVIALRLITLLLPQPIAEAIEDCIRGVMERRFIQYITPAMGYTSKLAYWRELYYTAYPARIDIGRDTPMTDRRQWEAVVGPIIRDKLAREAAAAEARRAREAVVCSSDSSSSEEHIATQSCWAADDGW
jgi:hypothetical protein